MLLNTFALDNNCAESQLHRIIGIHYPRKISNADLYEKCNMQELATIIRNARWRILGHTLRMTDATPAKHAMLLYFDKITKGFMGRPRVTGDQQRPEGNATNYGPTRSSCAAENNQ